MSSKQGKGTRRKATRAADNGEGQLERLEALLGELAGLRYEEDQERFDDIVAELVNFGPQMMPRLLELAGSIAYQERRAAVEAFGRLEVPEGTAVLLERLEDANWKVKRSAAAACGRRALAEAVEPLVELLEDSHRELRLASIEALGRVGRVEAAEALARGLGDSDWRIRQESAIALGRVGAAVSFDPLLSGLTDDDEDVQLACAEALGRLVGEMSPEGLRERLVERDDKARRALLQALQKETLAAPLGRLVEQLGVLVSAQVDVDEISHFGRVLTAPDQRDGLDHAFGRDKEVEALLKVLRKEGNSSVILVGEAGVGKTAIIHDMARRLVAEDPTCAVLETSTPELMVGTKYIGEWETKLHDLVEKIKAPRRVYLYLTNVNDLPGAGTTSSNKQNFVTLLAPYMRRGDITVIGESTAEALRTGIEKDLSVKRLFQTISVTAPDLPRTLEIVRARLDELSARHKITLEASNEVVDLLVDLSGTYYSAMAQPGRSLTVLQQVVDHILERRPPTPGDTIKLEAEDVIKGLARFTGMPELLLNDELPLDPGDVRQFFQRRVLGQPEAVDAIVDLITLIKAGLTDPTKPFGVFLFVGPTGVGKTELAKALAEFIFGSPERLLRFDLSEYRDYESFEKLIGGTWRNREEGRLTGKIREQPFNVILLDEIEKAHPNIFDLFLQVFDDGRLTDAQGRTADFRHTIIIMTSNLASAFSAGGPLGFGGDEGTSLASPTGIMREVKRFFRPEFLNRIDQTVTFRPLTPEVMRRIARRELGRVLARSGLLRRRLVVDIAPSVLDFLMAQGFSQAFGARPLKRAIETRVLLPVAREIVQRGPGYGGDLLRVGAPEATEGRVTATTKVVVERASTELEERRQRLLEAGAAGLEGTGLEGLTHAPTTRRQAQSQWRAGHERLEALVAAAPPEALRHQIAAVEKEMASAAFWDDPDHAQRQLVSKAHRQGVLELYERLMSRRSALERNLEASRRVRLRDWHEQLVAWLVDLHLTEAMVQSLDAPPQEAP